jgi:hypothetical protein
MYLSHFLVAGDQNDRLYSSGFSFVTREVWKIDGKQSRKSESQTTGLPEKQGSSVFVQTLRNELAMPVSLANRNLGILDFYI